jgi:hypothetical protein
VSTNELVPAYYDGQDRSTAPVFLKTHREIKSLRKSGELDGWYQQNGAVFVIYRRAPELDVEKLIAAGSMRSAWGVFKSGYAGPNVWQMRRERGLEAQ